MKITLDQVMAACERTMFRDEMIGFCLACGEEVSNIEPDAQRVTCEVCGEPKVYGAEELLFRMVA